MDWAPNSFSKVTVSAILKTLSLEKGPLSRLSSMLSKPAYDTTVYHFPEAWSDTITLLNNKCQLAWHSSELRGNSHCGQIMNTVNLWSCCHTKNQLECCTSDNCSPSARRDVFWLLFQIFMYLFKERQRVLYHGWYKVIYFYHEDIIVIQLEYSMLFRTSDSLAFVKIYICNIQFCMRK